MKTIIHNIFYTLLLVAISFSVSFAQQAAPASKVSGALVNEQGKPLDYATVSLLRASDSTVVKGALSNDAGVYVFTNIKAGSYIIKATVVGYRKSGKQNFYCAR
jgi:iron complex outermembrane receptor protein